MCDDADFDVDDVEEDEPVKLSKVEKTQKALDKLGVRADKERVGKKLCMEDDQGKYVCSRRKGHPGMHIALVGDRVVHAWVNPDDPS